MNRSLKIALRLIVPLFAALIAAAALAEGQWGELTSDPGPGENIEAGETIAYTLTINAEAEGEQMVRLRVPDGTAIDEDSVIYRYADGTDPEYSIIWGNNGCVMALPRLFPGDTVVFKALISPDSGGSVLTCEVSWNGEVMALTNPCAAPEAPPGTASPTPDASPAPLAAEPEVPAVPPEASAAPDNGGAAALERRQNAALIISAIVFVLSVAGLITALVRMKKTAR